MLVHIYTGQNIIFYTDKRGISYGCIARRDYMYRLTHLSRWLTPLLASPNATFRVTKHDLLRRNQWLNTYFHPLSIPS